MSKLSREQQRAIEDRRTQVRLKKNKKRFKKGKSPLKEDEYDFSVW